jgi:uncharacterized protein (TIGR00369 family)
MTTGTPSAEHFRKLERAYAAAPINAFYAPTLRIAEQAAELSFEITPAMLHAAAAAHGSVYFKALDDAAFFAANSMVEDAFLLTTSFTIYFLRPVSEGHVTARGRMTHRSGRLFFAEASLEDSAGAEIARGSGTFMRSRIPLDAGVGYR